MKYLQLLFFLFCGFLFSQNLKKIKVIDSQDSKPISNVRLLFSNEVVYSNDDGFALIPENVKNLETSKSGYQTEKLNKVSEIISLTPLYQDIEEVKIVNIDVKKIFKDVSNRYSEIYYDKSAIYDVTFKQRAFENNDMKLLMIADGKFWSRDGSYNSKEAFNNKFDNFVQLQIDDLRYLKSKPYENFIIYNGFVDMVDYTEKSVEGSVTITNLGMCFDENNLLKSICTSAEILVQSYDLN